MSGYVTRTHAINALFLILYLSMLSPRNILLGITMLQTMLHEMDNYYTCIMALIYDHIDLCVSIIHKQTLISS